MATIVTVILRILGALVIVTVTLKATPLTAQTADEEIARKALVTAPSKIRDNIRAPGQPRDDLADEAGDLPPSAVAPPEDIPQAVVPTPGASVTTDAQLEEQEDFEATERTLDKPIPSVPPPEGMPPDRYQKALEHIRAMPAAEPPASSEPHTLLDWMLRLVGAAPAYAQSYQWTSIGPQPGQTSAGTNLAGRVTALAVDPNNNQRVLQGNEGGVWVGTPTNGIYSWVPLTDYQLNLDVHSLAILPANSQIIFDGTGGYTLSGGVGTLRSTNGGTSWCQIGPNDQGGAYTSSKLAVLQVTIDTSMPTTRMWVATSAGLWWSEDAYNPALDCANVTWHKISMPAGVTKVSNFLVSPLNQPCGRTVLYASTQDQTQTWYRSTDRGASWTNIGTGATNPRVIAGVVVGCPGGLCGCVSGADTLYAILFLTGQETCGNIYSLWRTTDSGSSWQHLTQADCLDANGDPGGISVAVLPRPAPTPSVIAYGLVNVWRSLDGGATFANVTQAVHADFDTMIFDPVVTNKLWVGTDGGLWYTSDFTSPTVNWTNLNTNISSF